jgi:flagellar basal body-associated protein FliL
MATPSDSSNGSTARRLGAWGWIAIVVIFGFLAAAIAYAVWGWNSMGSVDIPPMGWFLLIIGIIATLGVGGGLMALIFYSSRKQYDTEAHGIQEQLTPREPE